MSVIASITTSVDGCGPTAGERLHYWVTGRPLTYDKEPEDFAMSAATCRSPAAPT
jgi:hypothetical protein